MQILTKISDICAKTKKDVPFGFVTLKVTTKKETTVIINKYTKKLRIFN